MFSLRMWLWSTEQTFTAFSCRLRFALVRQGETFLRFKLVVDWLFERLRW